ncbi:MAG: aspartyl/glutamyl-tRNA amidotransferase subunit C [Gemmatimonadales bacterium]
MKSSSHVGVDEARRIATLARLRFDEEELERITGELNHILDHVEDLRALENRTGSTYLEGERSTTRGAGAEQPDDLRCEIAAFAPDWREGFFVVPPFPGVHQEDAG